MPYADFMRDKTYIKTMFELNRAYGWSKKIRFFIYNSAQLTELDRFASDSFLYLEGINLSKKDPTAALQFEVKLASGTLKKKSRIVKIGDNPFAHPEGTSTVLQRKVMK